MNQVMYWIREVDGHDDEIAETLAELHGLTFFDSAPLPNFDHGLGGSVVMPQNRLLLRVSSPRPTHAMPAISVGSEC
jgi:hypothetical protein